jgi:divalent metal cation (Fe/Co/Zn/Cd) transporter
VAISNDLKHRALLFVFIGESWNIIEAGVAIWSAIMANSVALLSYGLDSIIEIFAGLILIWRLVRQWKLDEEEEDADKKALKIVGLTFILLAVYILFQSLSTLLGLLEKSRESIVGIILTITSALMMTALYVAKSKIAEKLDSRALRAEAVESLMCDLQDLTILVGLGLNALLGWWWADPVAALILIPFLLKEGSEAIKG